MAVTVADIKALTKGILIISDTEPRADITEADTTQSIKNSVQSVVFPVFRSVGYALPADYPSSSFSIIATENLEIDANICKLVARDICIGLSRFGTLSQSVQVKIWEWGKEFEEWLDKVASSTLVFSGIPLESSTAPTNAPITWNTKAMFFERNNEEGVSSDERNQGIL